MAGNFSAYNTAFFNQSIAFLPTEANCITSGIDRLFYAMTHEDTETTMASPLDNGLGWQRNVCDVCAGELGTELSEGEGQVYMLDFLETAQHFGGWSAEDYEQFSPGVTTVFETVSDGGKEPECVQNGAEVPCQCIPQNASSAMQDATNPTACGSGQNMVLFLQTDPIRNGTPPWDVTAGRGYEGSLYAWLEISGGPLQWFAGGQHFPNVYGNLVETGPITWSSSGLIEIQGFGSGYGTAIPNLSNAFFTVPPGEGIEFHIYDPVWGQLNGTASGGTTLPVSVQAEYPSTWSSSYVPIMRPNDQFGTWTISTPQLLGSATCGQQVGQIVGPLPSGDAVVSVGVSQPSGITDKIASPISTDANGFAVASYQPQTPGTKTITFRTAGASGQLSVSAAAIQVPPEIDSLSTSYGLVGGGGPIITIHGRGLFSLNTNVVYFQYTEETTPPTVGQFPSGGVLAFGTSDGLSATFTLPRSQIPSSGGLGQVQLFVTSVGLASNSLPFNYVDANTPYLEINPYGGCSAPVYQNAIKATVLDDNGNFIDGAQIVFTPNPSYPAMSFDPPTITNGGSTVFSFTEPQNSPYGFTAAYGTTAVTGTGRSYLSLPGGACIGLSAGNPTPSAGHRVPGVYQLVSGTIWKPPTLGDPWDWAEPRIVHESSPYSPSTFSIYTLPLSWIWGLGQYRSESTEQWAAVWPYSSHSGANLCFTGRALNISSGSSAPDWQFTVEYPVDSSVPYGDYRVFGFNDTEAAWVEMPSVAVDTSSGYVIEATDRSSDPHGIVPGAVNGPYALTYWSSSTCP
ncbi:MAG: hypothetical protein ACYDDA_15200 [Acidiferrobacteraceae bacterium]